MNQILAAFLAILAFQSSAHAEDKIRIGVSELNPNFLLWLWWSARFLRAKSRISRFSQKRRRSWGLRRGSDETM